MEETCSINLDDELKPSSMFDQGGEFCSMRSNAFLAHNIGVVHISSIWLKWNLNMKLPVWPTYNAEKWSRLFFFNFHMRGIIFRPTYFLKGKILKSKFCKKRGATFFYDVTRKLGPLDFTQYRSKSSSF